MGRQKVDYIVGNCDAPPRAEPNAKPASCFFSPTTDIDSHCCASSGIIHDNMPRYSRIPAILRTVKHAQPKGAQAEHAPRLWNAKRRIRESQPLAPAELKDLQVKRWTEAWRTQTSPDVVEFIDQNTITEPSAIKKILRHPARYFSRPHNVPTSSRQQVYFPKFKVAMVRKPHDSPFFASFDVPLWFNKLDLKSYLKELYNVDVVHVRSFVQQKALTRRNNPNRRRQGAWKRPQSGKRMKVQLVEPFEYPREATIAEMNEQYVQTPSPCTSLHGRIPFA